MIIDIYNIHNAIEAVHGMLSEYFINYSDTVKKDGNDYYIEVIENEVTVIIKSIEGVINDATIDVGTTQYIENNRLLLNGFNENDVVTVKIVLAHTISIADSATEYFAELGKQAKNDTKMFSFLAFNNATLDKNITDSTDGGRGYSSGGDNAMRYHNLYSYFLLLKRNSGMSTGGSSVLENMVYITNFKTLLAQRLHIKEDTNGIVITDYTIINDMNELSEISNAYTVCMFNLESGGFIENKTNIDLFNLNKHKIENTVTDGFAGTMRIDNFTLSLKATDGKETTPF